MDDNIIQFPAPANDIEKGIYETADAIEAILKARAETHGPYDLKAACIQDLKDVMRDYDGWDYLSASQRESLDMIVHKIGRILTGNPNHRDHWDDIAGYARLISRVMPDGE